jgi:hypothetical protein
MPFAVIDETNNVYGLLVVVSRGPKNTLDGRARWDCRCVCGRMVLGVNGKYLRNGKKTNCGCERVRSQKKARADSCTGYTGVIPNETDTRYLVKVRSRYTPEGVSSHLGSFTDLEEAVRARNAFIDRYNLPLIKEEYVNDGGY